MLFADFPIANRCKIWFGLGLLYCTKSSTLWGAALFIMRGFCGAVKERIRTARALRFASRGAETPRWGVSRARLGEFLRAHLKSALQCAFAMRFLFRFQNNFSSISSAASVYCPFPRRSFLSLFIVIRMRRISSVEKVAFLSAGRESIFSISRPGFSVLWPSAFS